MNFSYKLFISVTGNVIDYKELINNTSKIAGSIEFDINQSKGLSTLYNLHIKEEYRRNGFAYLLRTVAIEKILSFNISQIITNPYSYSDDFPQNELLSFYKKHFIEMGAFSIQERTLYQGKKELIAIFKM